MSFNGLLPNPKGQRNLQAWAEQLYDYLSSASSRTAKLEPMPLLLSHRTANTMERTPVEGVMLYDPTYQTPVVSVNGRWVPLNVQVVLATRYTTAAAVNGVAVAAGGVAVPLNDAVITNTTLATLDIATGQFTLGRGSYQLDGGVSLRTTAGVNKTATGYIAEISDLTTPVGSARMVTLHTAAGEPSQFMSLSGRLDVPNGGGTYVFVVRTADTAMTYGLAHGITGYSNTFARLDISLIGLNE